MQKIVVIGAGILGASTAYHLAKLGAEVTLVDGEDPGQATDAAAGIVCPWLSQRRNKAWYQLAKGGARYYPELIAQLEADGEQETGYKQVGAISLHTEMNKLEQMAERARIRREDAPEIGEISILSPAETKKLFPPLAEEFGSVHVSGGARVNGRALRESLIRASIKNGVTFLKGNASLLMQGSKVVGMKLVEKICWADEVIITAGAWAKELLQPLGVHFLVKPQKAQIIHLELPETDTSQWPVVIPPKNHYILTFENGRVVVGSTHENESGFDRRTTAGGIHEILSKALEVAPGLSESTVIGALPDYEGIYVANGLGASGLTSGPYLGAELAKLVLGKPTEIDLSSYDVAGAFSIEE
jgi:D-amino-acid dehydrogenase